MARTGLYKSDIQKARESLLAQGRHPSVDAVRVELGNTGSKTTIHKYLKELDEEDGDLPKITLSDSLQDLVSRLAGQLQMEADAKLAAALAANKDNERQLEEALKAARRVNTEFTEQLDRIHAAHRTLQADHEQNYVQLQDKIRVVHGLEQQLAGLTERLRDNEGHRASLEQKHTHQRNALEHYRETVKTQRDQDQRRHDHTVQGLQAELRQLRQDLVIKQDEITRVNQEGVRLVSELSHSQQALREQDRKTRELQEKLLPLQEVAARTKLLESSLVENNERLRTLQHHVDAAEQRTRAADEAFQQSQIKLAATQAELEVGRTHVQHLQTMLAAALPSQKTGKEG